MKPTILMGKAQEIPLVRWEVQRMIDNQGVYICTDVNQPGAEIPVVSIAGDLRAIKLDTFLRPERFLETARIAGPFRFNPWISVADKLPTHFHSVLGFVTGGPLVIDDPMIDCVSYDPERNEWHQSIGTEDAIVTVSHWMFLPNAPQKHETH